MLKVTHFNQVTRFDLARTLAGRGRYWTIAYRVGDVLVDSGCAYTTPELLKSLGEKPIHCIINTHTHEDHIGANGLLQGTHPGLEILAHPLALPVLADPRRTQPLHPYRRLFWGWPKSSQGRPLQDGEEIEDGDFRFQAIYTPGHSPDHICLYEPRQDWLFTGDLFVGGRDRALRQDCDIWGIIASLKRLAALPTQWLFPGSARVRENPAEELRIKIDYYEALGGQVLELHKRGWSVPAILRKVCGGPMWVEVVTLGHFSRRHLVESYLGSSPHKEPLP
jgi:glyoxylase-like metal-dependent hydrolase (beta-lactamase superfamily II)